MILDQKPGRKSPVRKLKELKVDSIPKGNNKGLNLKN